MEMMVVWTSMNDGKLRDEDERNWHTRYGSWVERRVYKLRDLFLERIMKSLADGQDHQRSMHLRELKTLTISHPPHSHHQIHKLPPAAEK